MKKETSPKFQAGDRVYYPSLKRTGLITRCLNLKDANDVRRQGYRYEVSFRGADYLWSLLEGSLRDAKISISEDE